LQVKPQEEIDTVFCYRNPLIFPRGSHRVKISAGAPINGSVFIGILRVIVIMHIDFNYSITIAQRNGSAAAARLARLFLNYAPLLATDAVSSGRTAFRLEPVGAFL